MTHTENTFLNLEKHNRIDQEFKSPYGKYKIIYADWIASGRIYRPIEDILLNKFYPFVGNTHSESK